MAVSKLSSIASRWPSTLTSVAIDVPAGHQVGAYGWAFVKPVRKLYYNFTITLVSVVVAIVVGGIEGLGLVQGELNLSGPFWDQIGALNNNFGYATIRRYADP